MWGGMPSRRSAVPGRHRTDFATFDCYWALPYTIELQYDPEGAWFVRVKELRGCISQGDTPVEAVAMIKEAMELWLEVVLEDGDPICEPRELDCCSDRFVVCVPPSLHLDLARAADEEGVSLNQYVSVALTRAVGYAALATPVDGGGQLTADSDNHEE